MVRPRALRLVLASAALAGVLLSLLSRPTSTPGPVATPKPAEPAIAMGTDRPDYCAPGTPGAAFVAAVTARKAREEALVRTKAFADWLASWRRADAAERSSLAGRGIDLARARRAALAYLIQTDPRRALELAVAPGLRSEMPAAIRALLEQQVDARGDLEVLIACFGGERRTDRWAHAGGQRYQAFVFGRREAQPTKRGLPLHGIALDGVLALGEAPYRIVDDGEKLAAGWPWEATRVRVGGDVVTLANPGELSTLAAKLERAEAQPGPAVSASKWPGLDESPTLATTAATPAGWALGTKRLLWIKVDFRDLPGTPVTDGEIMTTAAESAQFFQNVSNARCAFTSTILPVVVRMPELKTHYEADGYSYSEISDEALKQARAYDAANGGTGTFDPDRYDRWVVVYATLRNHNYGGLGRIGDKGTWLNGYLGATTHELGHNQGLLHSHAWQVGSALTPTSPYGMHVEYGDIYDVMGGGDSITGFFNAAQKEKLGYFDGTNITTVSTAGIYRINRLDHRDASGVQALKIPTSLNYDYWVEYRRDFPAAYAGNSSAALTARLRSSVLVRWGARHPSYATGGGTYLLDMHPDNNGDMTDAGLAVGSTYTDADTGIHITPLGSGGSSPQEYMDVRVEIGAINGNHNPTIAASFPATTTLAARNSLTFSAAGADPDGDPIAYRWDFGDGQIKPATASVEHRWLKGGTYDVSVAALDGKGGIAVQAVTVNVADPLASWTRRAEGLATYDLHAVIYAGGKFVIGGESGVILTSPDGVTWSKLPPLQNSFAVTGLAANGNRCVAVGHVYLFPSGTGGAAFFSDDGVTWRTATVPAGAGGFEAVARGADRFIAVGTSGRIYSSFDGEGWGEVISPLRTDLKAIAYGAGRFVAVGVNGHVISSTNGLSWTDGSFATSYSLVGVARVGNGWRAVSNLEVWTSSDAISWTKSTSPAVFQNGNYFGLSMYGIYVTRDNLVITPSFQGRIGFTENEQRWETSNPAPDQPNSYFQAVAEGNGLFVVVGNAGNVFTGGTPTVIAPRFRDPTAFADLTVSRPATFPVLGTGFARLELLANGQRVAESSGTGDLTWTPPRVGTYQLSVRAIAATGESIESGVATARVTLPAWSWTRPAVPGAELDSALRVNGRWFIAGRAGTLFTIDATGATNVINLHTNADFRAIAYANGRFVLAGSGYDNALNQPVSSLWSSTDGSTWQRWADGEYKYFGALVYAAGKWVGVGYNGLLVSSPDGVTWTTRPMTYTGWLYGLAYGDNQWVAVGTGGQTWTSPDAITWTARTSGSTRDLNGVAFLNGRWVAVGAAGDVVTSTDAIAWTRTTPTTQTLRSVKAFRGSFVAAGFGATVLTSPDGLTWTRSAIDSGKSGITGIGVDGDDSLLLGFAGEYYSSIGPTLTWARRTPLTTEYYSGVVYAAGRFVAVSGGYDFSVESWSTPITTSTDGVTWTAWTPPANSFLGFNAISYGQQTFVAVGNSGKIETSTDATTWAARTSGVTANLFGVASSPTLHVAAGVGGLVLTSANGTQWTPRQSGTTATLRTVAYGGAGFVVAGDAGAIFTSPDGMTWTQRSSGTTANLTASAWVEGSGYLVGGSTGVLLFSADGVAWTTRNLGATSAVTAIYPASFGTIVAGDSAGAIFYSPDTVSWTRSTTPADRSIRGLAAGPTAMVAVGDLGASFAQALAPSAPAITTPPVAQAARAGESTTLAIAASGSPTIRWQRNGTDVAGATSAALTLNNVQPASTGLYTATATNASGTATSVAAIVGLTSTSKVVGAGSEVGADIRHPNGNIFDQVLLEGAAASVTADAGQVLRISCLDATDDIIQVEFAGAGTLSLVLDAPSGPLPPAKYNQSVNYMKGHAGIVVTGANETTNLSVFSVGRANAVNQALFKDSVTYDGFADIAFIAIASSNGKFGGLRTANASYFATKGFTGIYAPGVQFTGPVFIGDINAFDAAMPVLLLGSASDVRVTGGDLLQASGRPIQVSGISQLKFAAGSTSHGTILPAQTNKARLEENGVDVTSRIVVNP